VPSGKKPLVSIIIPLYNHESYVREAIESVLASSVKDFEILVVDDGSTDRSVEVVKRIEAPCLKLFTQKNMGAHQAINRGVSLATAPWIAILNSDDRFHQRKLERHIEFHTDNPDLEASASRVRYICEMGNPVPANGYLNWRYAAAKERHLTSSSLWLSLMKTNHLVTTSSLFINKVAFQEIGGVPPLRYNHDWFVFLTLAARKRFRILEEELVDYRRHYANTITEDEERARIEALFVAEWHLNRIFSEQPSSVDVVEAMNAIHNRAWVGYRLLLFLSLWRQYSGNDIIRACSMFASGDNPAMLYAIQLMREEFGTLNPKIAIKKYLGSSWLRWADKGIAIWSWLNRLHVL
jgi:glycosyltransferase involved in cell wall biosynthesis